MSEWRIHPYMLMAPSYISLAYFKDFRMIKLYLLPGKVQYGRGSILLQSPKTSFEFVMHKNLPIPF